MYNMMDKTSDHDKKNEKIPLYFLLLNTLKAKVRTASVCKMTMHYVIG